MLRELAFNKDCASEHICKYYGAVVDDSLSTISIAMEFCEGGSLDGVYREVKKLGARIGEKVLGKVAEGVLNGLTYLHGQRIIHRGMYLQWDWPHRTFHDRARYKTIQHPLLPKRASQALRFWRQRVIRLKR